MRKYTHSLAHIHTHKLTHTHTESDERTLSVAHYAIVKYVSHYNDRIKVNVGRKEHREMNKNNKDTNNIERAILYKRYS